MPITLKPTNAVKALTTGKKEVDSKHPYNNKTNHDALLKFCLDKMDGDRTNRNLRIARFSKIDSTVSGWITKYSEEDADRIQNREDTGEPAMVKQNLSLVQIHLDDMAAFFIDVFAPTRGVYFAMGDAGKNEEITKMAKLLSEHAKNTQRITQLNRFFTNALKYNLGGIETYWKTEVGTILSNNDSGELNEETDQTIWQGNAVDSLDMYNIFFDSNVDAIDVYREGEWCAKVEVKSNFHIMRENLRGKYHNIGDLLEGTNTDNTYKFYKYPAREANMEGVASSNKKADFASIWNFDAAAKDTGKAIELVTFHAFLNPKAWGLGTKEEYKLFRIKIASGKRIIQALEMNNAHNSLPYNFARPIDDQMGGSQKSFAEVLTPLQDFASFCMNTHSEGVRSQIYGTRIYNSQYIDVDKIPKGSVNMNIPTKPGARDVRMDQLVHKLSSDVDTAGLMTAMTQVMDLANQFFPATQLPSQVAGIDRAINSQVAAAVQGANKRLKKYGRVMIDQCMEPSKRMQILNSQQYFKGDESVNQGSGLEEITGEDLRKITVSANIGHGLMTLDRDKMVEDLKFLLQMVLQSQGATEQIDVVSMLASIGVFMDYGIDFESFRKKAPGQGEIATEDGQGEEDVSEGIPTGDGGGEGEPTQRRIRHAP